MTVVSVSVLKAKLSEYMARVKAGEELTVTERGQVVGHVIPRRQPQQAGHMTAERQAQLEEMARQGLIRLPKGRLPKEFWEGPFPTVPGNAAVEALLAEREASPY